MIVDQNASLRELTKIILWNARETKDTKLSRGCVKRRLVKLESRSACKCGPRTSNKVSQQANICHYQASRSADLYDELLSWVVIYEGFWVVFATLQPCAYGASPPERPELNIPIGIGETNAGKDTYDQVAIAGCRETDGSARSQDDNWVT